MTRLARERNRSALGWSLIGIGAWIGAEVAVALLVGLVHAIGIIIWAWPLQSAAASILTYVLALAAAVTSIAIVSRILRGKTTEKSFQLPPPPPDFQGFEQNHVE